MAEVLAYYFIPTLVCAAVVEAILWWWRSTNPSTSIYLLVAGGARAIAYSPAIAAGGHGAAVLPFFAAMILNALGGRFLDALVYNAPSPVIGFLIFAGCILLRQHWAKRAKAP